MRYLTSSNLSVTKHDKNKMTLQQTKLIEVLED